MPGPLPKDLFKLPIDSARPCKEYQYAAKAVCGNFGSEQILAPGRYFSAINIHNPSTCNHVTFRWKVAIAERVSKVEPNEHGRISRFQSFTLRPDEAVEIDNPDIYAALGWEPNQARPLKGFVVVESPCELDVVAVYSASSQPPASANSGATIHTERVPCRRIDACHDDMLLDLSTGKAPWWIVFGNGAPRLANVIEPPDVWVPLSGTKWISFRTSFPAQPPVPQNETVYQTCFNLCSGFEITSPLQLTVLADGGTIEFGVNDEPRSPVSATFSGPGTSISISPSQLRPGKNCITFYVADGTPTQTGGPSGLDVKAVFKIPRGACQECGCCGSDSLDPQPRLSGTP